VRRAQQGDAQAREDLLSHYRPFVVAQAAKVAGRYVREGEDDEYAIALIAFNESIDAYDPKRGVSFLAFSETVIRRRLIDFFRKARRREEVPLSAYDVESVEGHVLNRIDVREALGSWTAEQEAEDRRSEIAAYARVLESYGLSFRQLVASSPKHKDARESAREVARILSEREDLMAFVQRERRLPLKELSKAVQVSRKTLERQRKYILAVALAMRGDFPYIKGHFT